MFRFFLVLPFLVAMSFSWGCFCKQHEDCQEPDGSGLTEIYLRVSISHNLKANEYSPFRILFSAKGKTLECPIYGPSKANNCFGTFFSKGIDFRRHYNKIEQEIYIASLFFYKELRFLIEHDGVTLFDGVIDFSNKPNEWLGGVYPDGCTSCYYKGTAYLTSTVD